MWRVVKPGGNDCTRLYTLSGTEEAGFDRETHRRRFYQKRMWSEEA